VWRIAAFVHTAHWDKLATPTVRVVDPHDGRIRGLNCGLNLVPTAVRMPLASIVAMAALVEVQVTPVARVVNLPSNTWPSPNTVARWKSAARSWLE